MFDFRRTFGWSHAVVSLKARVLGWHSPAVARFNPLHYDLVLQGPRIQRDGYKRNFMSGSAHQQV